ncbi:sulfotransferase [Qipengyuania sp. GH1]|uniref:sulfotransferase family protein n=1 Tax=Qipengyuania aestuarii TaxID=2867241 RepID=UPI001C8715B9|nr:sulfotransferase [Qipengyuania aestuarii]MBX7535119.1 sulfotransferase [Qipengyuania aestuarii]
MQKLYGSAVASNPKNTLADLREAIEQRDRAAINSATARLVADAAPLGERWVPVIKLLSRNGEWSLADAASRLRINQGGDFRAKFDHAALAANFGRVAEAIRMADDLPDDCPSVAEVEYLRGTLAMTSGDFGKAHKHFMAVLEAAPMSGQTMLALSSLPEDRIGQTIKAREASMANAPASERSAYFFALGNILHKEGNFEKAYKAFCAANRLAQGSAPYDQVVDRESASRSMNGWSDRPIFNGERAGGASTIFVTGLPRSGTTLVEQILCANRLVSGAGEVSLLRLLAQDIGGSDAASYARFAEHRDAGSLAALYRHLVEQRGLQSDRKIIDKSLDSSRFMGILLSSLPEAKVVWIRRNARSCAWSNFRTNIVTGADWSHSPTDIAHHFKIEDALFDFWIEKAPQRIHPLPYEALVAEPRQALLDLCAFLGLEFSEAMLRPENVRRAVTTASVAQVRQPIKSSSLGQDQAYKAFSEIFSKEYLT